MRADRADAVEAEEPQNEDDDALLGRLVAGLRREALARGIDWWRPGDDLPPDARERRFLHLHYNEIRPSADEILFLAQAEPSSDSLVTIGATSLSVDIGPNIQDLTVAATPRADDVVEADLKREWLLLEQAEPPSILRRAFSYFPPSAIACAVRCWDTPNDWGPHWLNTSKAHRIASWLPIAEPLARAGYSDRDLVDLARSGGWSLAIAPEVAKRHPDDVLNLMKNWRSSLREELGLMSLGRRRGRPPRSL